MKQLRPVFIMVLSILFVVSFLGCSQSEAAKAVDEQISTIGEVSLSSLQAIKDAEQAYNRLDESDKKQVRKYNDLLNARTTYYQLRANKVITDIENIGTVNLNSFQEIVTAEKSFKELSADERAFVTNYDVLEKARSDYDLICAENVDQLIEEAVNDHDKILAARDAYVKLSITQRDLVKNYKKLSEAKILQVIDAINKIDDVSLENSNIIEEAQKLYNSLVDDEKKQITNSRILTDAVKKLDTLKAEKEKQKISSLMQRISETTDEVTGITWYKSTSEPYYTNVRSYVLPYIGKTGNTILLRLVYNYAGNDWIFFKRAHIVTDIQRYQRSFNYFDILHKTYLGAKLNERLDIPASKNDADMLRDIANSTNATIRLEGDYYTDITLSNSDKQAISDILALYEYLSEQPGTFSLF